MRNSIVGLPVRLVQLEVGDGGSRSVMHMGISSEINGDLGCVGVWHEWLLYKDAGALANCYAFLSLPAWLPACQPTAHLAYLSSRLSSWPASWRLFLHTEFLSSIATCVV